MTIEVETLEKEADWAYKYGQEARKAIELDWRLNAAIFDLGVLTGILNKFVALLGEDSDEWMNLIPPLLDQKFDCEEHVRNHLQRPVGSFAEQDRVLELQDRIKEKIATRAEMEEYDEMTGSFLEECNKKVLQEYSNWQEAELGLSSKQSRKNHRNEWTEKLPKVFAKLAANKGLNIPEELIIRVLGTEGKELSTPEKELIADVKKMLEKQPQEDD